jgi:beta-lactamase class A
LIGRNYWDEQGTSQIPSDVFVASKNGGAVDESRSEIMFVNGRAYDISFACAPKTTKTNPVKTQMKRGR